MSKAQYTTSITPCPYRAGSFNFYRLFWQVIARYQGKVDEYQETYQPDIIFISNARLAIIEEKRSL
ncbi:hypothetical protein MGLY_25470 [Neomoorella glycerini]|uniref:Uncharacterized protein n=1 Tax=Neomoorella glycerini TaxID=55779 RepID=A0A6I5ZUF1_9FIRM|nr:hypothetical protein MGLY_25470 [Moorella glycerini]